MQKATISTDTDSGSGNLPLYLQLAGDVRQLIERGVFKIGDRLPSVRDLRRKYRVSAATAVQAYVWLERDGLVKSRERSGFYAAQPIAYPEPKTRRALVSPVGVGIGVQVLDLLRRINDRSLVPLGVGSLGPELLPVMRVNRAIRRAAARSPLHSAFYGTINGAAELRRQIARLQFAGGFSGDPDNIVVTSGGLEALNLALRAVAKPGEVIAVESPTYFGVLQAAESLGVKVVEVPAHPRSGIDLDLLERAIKQNKIKAVIVMPNCHNPQGTVMSDDAKAELVALTHGHNVAVIEDDIYGELAYTQTRPRTAKSYDRKGLVLLCGSFSKVLAPGLRVGWIEPGQFRTGVETLKSITSLVTATLPQLAIAELLESGFYERYVRRLRIRLADRVSRYVSAITKFFPPGTRMTQPSGGNLLWIQLPKNSDGTLLYHRAMESGISILPGEIFSPSRKHQGFIRVSCGAPWSPKVEDAIETLAELCRQTLD